MPGTVERETISPPLERAVPTKADRQSPISPTAASIIRQEWQRVIRDVLENWLRNPNQLADDGIEPPSGMVLRTALDVADEFQDQLLAVPDRVTADANGGIVFEKIDGHQVEVVHVWGDGAVEYMKFTGTQLILRQPISGR